MLGNRYFSFFVEDILISEFVETSYFDSICRALSIQSFRFAVSFQGISRLSSDIFLWWFKLTHIYIQETSLQTDEGLESISNFWNGKSVPCNTTYLQPHNLIQIKWNVVKDMTKSIELMW